ncbi:MAG TPA: ABC transporter substrate-binding protein [Bacilli bacterium]
MKKLSLLVILLILLPVMSACRRDRYKITISEVAHSVFYAPQYVALSQGFFEEEGLEVTIINSNGADKVMAALLSRDVQIGLAGAEATIYVYAEGQENYAINFAQLTQKDGSFLVGREPIEDFDFSMLSGTEILGGRLGGMPEMVLEYALKLNGLDVGRDDPTKEVNVRTDVQFGALAGAFTSGQGDYVSLFEPTGTLLEKEGKGYVVASLGTETGIIPYTNYFTTKSYLEKNEDIIQKFTNAIYKGAKWVHSHTAREIAEACSSQFPDLSIDELTIVMQRYVDIDAWAHTPVMQEETYNRFLDIMEEADMLPSRVPYNKIVTTKFANEAVKNIG